MNEPVYGCTGCAGTAGRSGCMLHAEPITVSAGGIPYNNHEIERLREQLNANCLQRDALQIKLAAAHRRIETASGIIDRFDARWVVKAPGLREFIAALRQALTPAERTGGQ